MWLRYEQLLNHDKVGERDSGWWDFDLGMLPCTECKDKVPCDACKKRYPKKTWPAKALKNAKQQGSKLVCAACRSNGVTAYDLKLYSCQECRHLFGGKKFQYQALKNYKFHGCKRLICTACTDISGVTAVKRSKEKESQAGERACPENEVVVTAIGQE